MRLIYQPRELIKQNNGFVQTKGNLVLFQNDDRVHSVWLSLSGGWGKGTIPHGYYSLGEPAILDDVDKNKAYKADGFPWWIGLTPETKTDRSGFGIHPDGNYPGSLGCICPIHHDIKLYQLLTPFVKSGELKVLEVL